MVTGPSKSQRSVRMVEVTNKIIQSLMAKVAANRNRWDFYLERTIKAVNGRHMVELGYSPVEILMERARTKPEIQCPWRL